MEATIIVYVGVVQDVIIIFYFICHIVPLFFTHSLFLHAPAAPRTRAAFNGSMPCLPIPLAARFHVRPNAFVRPEFPSPRRSRPCRNQESRPACPRRFPRWARCCTGHAGHPLRNRRLLSWLPVFVDFLCAIHCHYHSRFYRVVHNHSHEKSFAAAKICLRLIRFFRRTLGHNLLRLAY